jgi:hypothetical protein
MRTAMGPVFGGTDLRVLREAFAKLRKATISFVTSVRSHGTIRFPMDGFS